MQHVMNRIGTRLRTVLVFCGLGLVVQLEGCKTKEETVPVSVMGYNHMSNWSIADFSVNGAGGMNLSPEEGGGGSSCCAVIPMHWHPGMKAKVAWRYDTDQGGPRPPPPQETVVDIPEYTPENLGDVQVHFYPNHRVKVVMSKYDLGHPLYPLQKEDWAPWELNQDWARNYQLDLEEEKKK